MSLPELVADDERGALSLQLRAVLREHCQHKFAVQCSVQCQPTNYREKASTIAARPTNSVVSRMHLMSATQSWLTPVSNIVPARFGKTGPVVMGVRGLPTSHTKQVVCVSDPVCLFVVDLPSAPL